MILIIGATGTVGRELVRLLATRGIPLRALTRDPARAEAIAYPGVEIVIGDLAAPETLAPALAGIGKLFLLTPSSPEQAQFETQVIELARQTSINYIIKLSSLGASEASPIAMSRWHRRIEKIIETSGIAWTFLRPQNFMQNLLGSSVSIRSQGVLKAPMGKGRMSLVDARDVAAAAAAVLTQPGHEGKIYRLTGSQALSFGDIAAAFSEILGRPIRYEDVTEDQIRLELEQAGFPPWLIDDQIAIYRHFRGVKNPLINTTLEQLTGRQPRTLKEFIRDYRAEF